MTNVLCVKFCSYFTSCLGDVYIGKELAIQCENIYEYRFIVPNGFALKHAKY